MTFLAEHQPSRQPSPRGHIDFTTAPERYHHWKLRIDGRVAWLGLDVSETDIIGEGYELKLNSYDLGVDIELHDAVERLRFEHPEVACVVVHSCKERVFCAGANIRMLGKATHAHKVNFCKFTNETRNGIENATTRSGQTYLCAVKGSCAGGGYELALACDEILLADDGASSVSLPELPLLAVLPGTGGLTRLVDKRRVRRDRADFFCTLEEGVRGKRAQEWGLVDSVIPLSTFDDTVSSRAQAIVDAALVTPGAPGASATSGHGIALTPIARAFKDDEIQYQYVHVAIDRTNACATLTLRGPSGDAPASAEDALAQGTAFWSLAIMRDLDDALLHLRFNEETVGTWVFRTEGDVDRILAHDALLAPNQDHWFIRETTLLTERVLKRLDVTARSLLAHIEPGSCFAGTLFECALAADQSYMLLGQFEDDDTPEATIALSAMNFGPCQMVNGITRLQARFLDDAETWDALQARVGERMNAQTADEAGLVTFIPDDIDWEYEVRIAIESRAGFSPDALTGMEANLRFPGPETMESKIFSRLSAWQNWIFQRPNAVGANGALVLYGTGDRPQFQKHRV
jgi:benzoyl-CoA-dihydrodiol lyase